MLFKLLLSNIRPLMQKVQNYRLPRRAENVVAQGKGGFSPDPRRKSAYNIRSSIDYDSPSVQRILNAAATVFANQGFYGARMDEIAELANINKSQLYYHIGNKEKIYGVILQKHFTDIADQVENAVKGCDDPIEGIKIIVDVHAQHFNRDDRAPRTVAHELADGAEKLTLESYYQYVRIHSFMQHFVEKGISSGLFRNVNPAEVNVLLTGTLLVSAMNKPFRRNFAKDLGVGEDAMPSIDDMAEFAFNVVINYLTRQDTPQ